MVSDKSVKNVRGQKGEKKQTFSIITTLVFLTAVVVLCVNFFSLCSQINEKKEKYAALERLYEEELVIEQEYNYYLDKENRLEYIERIAREKYGYIAPGERAFFDSSYGK